MISYKMTWNLCGTENLIWFQAKNNNFILSLNPKRLLKIIIKAEIKLKWKKKKKKKEEILSLGHPFKYDV